MVTCCKRALSVWSVSTNASSPGVVVELLRYVVHHVVLRGLVGHGFAEFAGHQGLGHGLLTMLPEEESHLLPLHQHGPHQQLVEGVGEAPSLGIINVHNVLLALLLGLLSRRFQLEGTRTWEY